MNSEEFLNKIRTELKISKNSIYTIRNYLKINLELLEFCKKNPDQITKDDVKNFLAEKLDNKAVSSVILALAAIRYAFQNILEKDPTLGIKRPKKEKKIPVVLTKEEIIKLIDSAKTEKSRLMMSLMYALGLRVSELINLKVENLHFDEKIGYIRSAKGKKDRQFNIPLDMLNELQEIAKKQKEQNQEYLFSGSKGKLSSQNIQKIVRNTSKLAGIDKPVHCHTLRHSFATHLLENGIDIRIIQELLGHENLDTTQIYAHVSSKELKKVPSPFDSLREKPFG